MIAFWFVALAWMLAMYVVLSGFDLGSGMLQLIVARGEAERRQVLATIRPVWKGNEVWLVAAGGTLFMAFPKLLGTAFSGFYLPLMCVLWLLVFRSLAIELRVQIDDGLWRQAWDVCWSVASLALVLFLGAALGNVVRGVSLDEQGVFFAPLWTDFGIAGRVGILDWYTLLVGATAVLAIAHHGAAWLALRTDGPVSGRARGLGARLWPLLCAAVLAVSAASFAVQPLVKLSLSLHPWGVVSAALAAAGLVGSFVGRRRGRDGLTLSASCLCLVGLLGCAAAGIWPYVLPAREVTLGLTAQAAAAGSAGLGTALYWWLPGMALACAYSLYHHRHLDRRVPVEGSSPGPGAG